MLLFLRFSVLSPQRVKTLTSVCVKIWIASSIILVKPSKCPINCSSPLCFARVLFPSGIIAICWGVFIDDQKAKKLTYIHETLAREGNLRCFRRHLIPSSTILVNHFLFSNQNLYPNPDLRFLIRFFSIDLYLVLYIKSEVLFFFSTKCQH